MPYPVQTFNNFDDLLAYINSEWITNGTGTIDAVIGNNVVNGLLAFIRQSPLNYQTAEIVSTGVPVTNPRPVTVFMTTPAASLQWPDNIYNQYFFVNTTSVAIPLSGGMLYYDIDLVAQTTIPANTTVLISKANNGQWISLYNASGGSGTTTRFHRLQFTIGQGDSPMNDGDTVLEITVDNPSADSESVILDGPELFRDLTDRVSYGIDYTSTKITITFNQGVINEQTYLIKYATTS